MEDDEPYGGSIPLLALLVLRLLEALVVKLKLLEEERSSAPPPPILKPELLELTPAED